MVHIGDLDDRTVGGEFEAACFLGRGAADAQDFFDLVDVEADVVEPGRDALIGERTLVGFPVTTSPAPLSTGTLNRYDTHGFFELASATNSRTW
ncbi:MAG: hypothetical protein ACRDR6_05180 [Pseudonocardiaceae bacterium]